MNENDETLAFKLLHEVSEKLKERGLDAGECWALMFAQLQDLQAADFGMGSDEHQGHVQAQHDSLADDLAKWDDVGGVEGR